MGTEPGLHFSTWKEEERILKRPSGLSACTWQQKRNSSTRTIKNLFASSEEQERKASVVIWWSQHVLEQNQTEETTEHTQWPASSRTCISTAPPSSAASSSAARILWMSSSAHLCKLLSAFKKFTCTPPGTSSTIFLHLYKSTLSKGWRKVGNLNYVQKYFDRWRVHLLFLVSLFFLIKS